MGTSATKLTDRPIIAFLTAVLAIVAALAFAPQAQASELVAAQSTGATSSYALLKANGCLVPCDSSGVEISGTWSGSREDKALESVYTVFVASDVGTVLRTHKVKYSEEYQGRTVWTDNFSSVSSFQWPQYEGGLPGLTFVKFLPGSKCTAIGEKAFLEASSLSSISLPDGVGGIGNEAFRGCTALYDVKVGNSLRSVGKGSFYDCSSLTEIDLPATFSTVDTSEDGWNGIHGRAYGSGSFCRSGLTKVTIRSETPVSDGSGGKDVWKAFKYTPIAQTGAAYIYVPTSALAAYRTYYGEGGENGDGWSYFNQSHLNKLRGIDGEPASIDSASMSLSMSRYTYDGTPKTPDVSVTLDGKALVRNADYIVSYTDNVDAGTATATVTGAGLYAGTVTAQFEIDRAANTLRVKGKTAKVSRSGWSQSISASRVLAVTRAQGDVVYKKVSGTKKISVNRSNGGVTVKGGIKRGVYRVQVKVTAKGDENHKKGTKTATFKVRVK